MRRHTGKLIIGLVAALLLAASLAGAGLARESGGGKESAYTRFVGRVAELLGKRPDEVRSAMARAQRELVNEAVAQGKVSTECARKLEQRAERGGGMKLSCGKRPLVGRVANVDGSTLTVTTRRGEVKVQLQKGTIIRQQGRTASAQSIRAGSFVKVRGDRDASGVLKAKQVRILHGKGALRRGSVARLRVASSFLGMEPREVRAQLRQGKSLAQIAGPQKTPQLINALVSATAKRIDAAVESGKLSPEKAAKLKGELRERVTKLVNRQHRASEDSR
jgi:polyhydroxyalkanoate synthesis regulator phasin